MQETFADRWLDQESLQVHSGCLLRQLHALDVHVYGLISCCAGSHAERHRNAVLLMRSVGLQQTH